MPRDLISRMASLQAAIASKKARRENTAVPQREFELLHAKYIRQQLKEERAQKRQSSSRQQAA